MTRQTADNTTTMNKNTIMVNTSSDPFKEVLFELNDIAGKVASLIPPVTDLDTAVSDATAIVADVDTLFKELDDVCTAISVTRDVCLGLTPIPVIGEIADEAASILSDVSTVASQIKADLSPIKKDVDKVGKILTKVKNGLDETIKVFREISTDIPDFTNTITILNCLMEIAQPLTEVLKGNAAADRLNKLIDDYNKIKEEVSGDVQPIVKAIDDMLTIVQEFVNILTKTVEAVDNSLGGAINSIKSVDSILSPISNAMKKVEHAIAPVKWALDAASCIFDKVFKPVIDEVLKVTGLSSLVKSLENKLKSALGINNVIGALEHAFDVDKIVQFGGVFDLSSDTSGASVTANKWSSLSTTLGVYSQNNNEGTKKAVDGLVNAIVGTDIDPNKPSIIPDWPNPPHYRSPDESRAFTIAASSTPLTQSITALNRIQDKPAKMSTTFLDSFIDLSRIQLNTGTDAWSDVTMLKSAIQQESDQLNTLIATAQLLQTNLTALQQSLQIPATFAEQLSDLGILFRTSHDLFSFIAELNLFKEVLTPVADVLNDQVSACTNINSAMPNLQSAVNNIANAVNPVLQHVPSAEVIHSTINTLSGWSNGADSLVRMVEASDTLNPNTQQKQKVLAGQQEINLRCAAVNKTVQNITQTATEIANSINSINALLNDYKTALLQVTQHDQLISTTALPKVTKITRNLKTLDSIFDPLSELLQLTGCVDADNPMKSGANLALTAINTGAKTTGSSMANTVVTGLKEITDQYLPLDQLNTDVVNATQKLDNDVVVNLQNQCQILVQKLDNLTQLLTARYNCTYTNAKGEKVTTPNPFVDTTDVITAVDLIKTFQTPPKSSA